MTLLVKWNRSNSNGSDAKHDAEDVQNVHSLESLIDTTLRFSRDMERAEDMKADIAIFYQIAQVTVRKVRIICLVKKQSYNTTCSTVTPVHLVALVTTFLPDNLPQLMLLVQFLLVSLLQFVALLSWITLLLLGSRVEKGGGATTKTHPNSDFATANASTHQTECKAISSRQMFEGKGRKKRMCVVCRFEGRYPTEVTDYCRTHSVCLCKLVHGDANTPFTCPESTWTCWEKFHRFYLPNGLFSAKGNLQRSSRLATLWAQHRCDTSDDTLVPSNEK
ncbi:hypothetical protein P3T76_012315 [Phytophthora citrophthora]|uniref:Uncharacterized protein n=1 Tax=Phytophthora citrophthora TaxID=4793 RepID=A0AAD9G5Q0_9STRA|nr:hypothetical protein P3T76_012315 [Phytophthora citrophthora]